MKASAGSEASYRPDRDDDVARGRIHVLGRHLAARSDVGNLSISGTATKSVPHKVVTAADAVGAVPDVAVLTVSSFVGTGCPEALLEALRERFEKTGHPRGLRLWVVAPAGDGKGRGFGRLAAKGLVSQLVYAWIGLSPEFMPLIQSGEIQGWNLPLGVMSHIFREVAAGKPGPLTHVGLGTFVDPREGGGKKSSPNQHDIVHVMQVGGRELLWYKAPSRMDVALLRGTYADEDGNISLEHEALLMDLLNQAMAVHNSGGTVIVQVRQIVQRGSIPPRLVHIPGVLVDKVVVADPGQHWQTFHGQADDHSLTGALRAPAWGLPPLGMGARRVIAHRALLEIDRPHAIINLGVGMPEGVASMVASHGETDIPGAMPVTLSTEAGHMGGIPAGGRKFGAAHNAAAHMPTSSMIDLYQGGGVDIAFLGMAEVDREGNVNVSSFEGRAPGCGGFIDISQSAKKVVFLGTFTSGALQVKLAGNKLIITHEGRHKKFCEKVFEKTFAASAAGNRPIKYITERAVFVLQDGRGVELTEIAPGVDLERDVLAHMGFRPLIREPLGLMDARCFGL